jgi:Dyp-type peroxidase family
MFPRFLLDHRLLTQNTHSPQEGAAFLGARFVGRWKSGAPIARADKEDNLELARDPLKNNAFTFDHKSQVICPFAAHIRKMNPRGDIPEKDIGLRRIMRRGIPYGPEITDREKLTSETAFERGLLFVCYQSRIERGFEFLQRSEFSCSFEDRWPLLTTHPRLGKQQNLPKPRPRGRWIRPHNR